MISPWSLFSSSVSIVRLRRWTAATEQLFDAQRIFFSVQKCLERHSCFVRCWAKLLNKYQIIKVHVCFSLANSGTTSHVHCYLNDAHSPLGGSPSFVGCRGCKRCSAVTEELEYIPLRRCSKKLQIHKQPALAVVS